MAVPGPRVSSIHQDTLWLHTLETVKASVAARRPLRFRRKAITEYVTGMLDKELWLTTEQREPLRELVDSAFPQVIETQRPRLKEFELLAVPLFRIQDDQLATVLRESQVAAWHVLQNEFRHDGNTVWLPSTNGERFEFQLPE